MSAIAEDFRYQIPDNRLKSLCAKGLRVVGVVGVSLRRLPRIKALGAEGGRFRQEIYLEACGFSHKRRFKQVDRT